MQECVIYRAVFPNGKCYVGQSWDYDARKKRHKTGKACRALYNAIAKHGEPDYRVIVTCFTQAQADECEIAYIAYYKAKGESYNIRLGGSRGRLAGETKRLISIKGKGRKCKPFTEAHRRNMSLARKGKKHTKETREKMSQNSARYWRGKKLSAETRLKMSKPKRRVV